MHPEELVDEANKVIAEVPGLYGAVGIPELLIQKIWLRQDIRQSGLRVHDGRTLKVVRPGRWNRLGGPDFLGAEIELGGQRQLGDIEIHFYERDWMAHLHNENPTFDGVILHVVVFPGRRGAATPKTSAGQSLPVLHLAPLLREGLEAYAMQDALLSLEKADPLELAAPLLKQSLPVRRELLRKAGTIRWKQKHAFAQKRLAAAKSWTEACHQVALEILGYSRNRARMAELAWAYPFAEWTGVDSEIIDKRYSEKEWKLTGNRPANHPRRRLEQYASIVSKVPDWPEKLLKLLREAPVEGVPEESTRTFRQRLSLSALRKEINEQVFSGVVASPRADTLLIDGFLPLAAAQLERPELAVLWMHWWPGDLPAALKLFLRTVGVMTPDWPLSNGLQQAALQTLIERTD